MKDNIINSLWFVLFLLISIYVVPAAIIVKKYDDKWNKLVTKKGKTFGESLLFTWYLVFYGLNWLILSFLEPKWEKTSVYKL